MKIFTVAKNYFKHPSIWLYIFLAFMLAYISISQEYFAQNWYSFIIIIAIAPFFEWVVHKYVLHIKIGNVLEIENTNNYKKGDKFNLNLNNKSKEVEVLNVSGSKIQVGYGFAKYKIIRNYMQRLHFGHHTNPDITHLVFAQTSAAILIFVQFFLLSWLITFRIDFAIVFTFYLVLYYLHYEWMHLAHHIPGYKHFFPWSNTLKEAHLLHHYRNENYWYGITNNIGDLLLGTFPKKNEVEKSSTVHNINQFPEEFDFVV